MTTLIMLCGQGSAGKSFFGTLLYQWLENSSFIRMDSYVDNSIGYQSEIDLPKYIEGIQKAIDKQYEYIILDFAHDSKRSRKDILDKLKFHSNNTYAFICVSLRPTVDVIIQRHTHRKGLKRCLLQEVKDIKNCYDHFEYPSEEEFKDYPFEKINLFTINNSQNLAFF